MLLNLVLSCLLCVATVLCAGGCATTPESAEALNDRVQTAVQLARDAAASAELASSISIRALENGEAAKQEAERQLRIAKEAGDEPALEAAARSLREVSEELTRSKRVADRVFACYRRVCNLADQVKSLAGRVTSCVLEPGSLMASRKAERLAGQAARTADEAEKSVEFLKKRWLSVSHDPSMI